MGTRSHTGHGDATPNTDWIDGVAIMMPEANVPIVAAIMVEPVLVANRITDARLS
jgi:hypothetical protein